MLVEYASTHTHTVKHTHHTACGDGYPDIQEETKLIKVFFFLEICSKFKINNRKQGMLFLKAVIQYRLEHITQSHDTFICKIYWQSPGTAFSLLQKT